MIMFLWPCDEDAMRALKELTLHDISHTHFSLTSAKEAKLYFRDLKERRRKETKTIWVRTSRTQRQDGNRLVIVQFSDVTWRRLPPAAVWQTVEEYAGRARSPPSAPGSGGGCRLWWGSGKSVTWRPRTLKHTIRAVNHRDVAPVTKLTRLVHVGKHSPAFSSGSLHRDEDLDLMLVDPVKLSSTGRTIWHKHTYRKKSQQCLPEEIHLTSSFTDLWWTHENNTSRNRLRAEILRQVIR